MALSDSERSTLGALFDQWSSQSGADELAFRYYHGRQRVEQLGLAIPPPLRRFLVITNWPRVVVDTLRGRMRLRSLGVAGVEGPDKRLQDMRRANNLDAHLAMFCTDVLVYGRGFLSAGTRANSNIPLVRAESPRQIAATVDVRDEVMTAAARFYGVGADGQSPTNATLYLPGETIHCEKQQGKWSEVGNRSTHKLDRVPMVMHLNRRMSGEWVGESEMTDIIPIADSAVRSLTNLQFTQEAHGFPRKWMTGVSREDFVDKDGKAIPAFEAYMNAIHTLTKSDARVGQLDASDLKNFETAMNIYGSQASILTGFPSRYFGHFTANPPNEASMKADEAQLVAKVEDSTAQIGVTLGWLGDLALRLMTGAWADENSVTVEWHDPATPTVAQREDALSKRRSQGVISREGYWDELGWSEERKRREAERLAAEAADPLTAAFLEQVNAASDAATL